MPMTVSRFVILRATSSSQPWSLSSSAFSTALRNASSPRDEPDDHRRGHARRGRQLGCVEHAQSAAGACSHIEYPAAMVHAGNDLLDQLLYCRDRLFHCQRHLLVFGIDVTQAVRQPISFSKSSYKDGCSVIFTNIGLCHFMIFDQSLHRGFRLMVPSRMPVSAAAVWSTAR